MKRSCGNSCIKKGKVKGQSNPKRGREGKEGERESERKRERERQRARTSESVVQQFVHVEGSE